MLRMFNKTLPISIVATTLVGLWLPLSIQSAWAAEPAHKAPTVAHSEAIAPAGTVIIGDFAGEAVHNKQYGTLIPNHGHGEFGWGWTVSTDQLAGGHSIAGIALIRQGANGTQGALQISGEIKPGFPYPWAGAIWLPGHNPMQPADLSIKKQLVFWARGAIGHYTIMLQSGSPHGIPLYASFTTSPHWKQYHIPLATSFRGANLKKVFFIVFSASKPGKFQFDIDQVSLR